MAAPRLLLGTGLLATVLAIQAHGATGQPVAPPVIFRVPPAKTVVLPNGLTLVLMEHRAVPLISVAVVVRAGASTDPVGKEGLASLTASLLRAGSSARSAEQFSEELDAAGATFQTSVGVDATHIVAECSKAHLTRVLDLIGEALTHPMFPDREVERRKAQRLDEALLNRDDPELAARLWFNAWLYRQHPYGHPVDGDRESLASITREDVASFHGAFYTPGITAIAMAGDFVIADVEDLLAARFGPWPAKSLPGVAIEPAQPVAGPRVLLVDAPGADQTYFRIGALGPSRSRPDRIALRLANVALGGRVASVVGSVLRTVNGRTSGVVSSLDEQTAGGAMVFAARLRTESTAAAVNAVLGELRRVRETGVTDEELATTKAYVVGQFPRAFESSERLARALADLTLNGADVREPRSFVAAVTAASAVDVSRAVGDYLKPDGLAIVLVGDADRLQSLADRLAKDVVRVSMTDSPSLFWKQPK